MTNTAHRAKDETIVANLAKGYTPAGASGFERATYLDWTSKTGNGSLYSTADDLFRFHRALQNGKLLNPETLRQSYGFDRKDRTVGMFWFHRERFGHRSVYANGSSPGFKAHFERFIDDDATIVVLSNLYIGAPSTMAEDLAAMLFDQPVNRDVPKPVQVNASDLNRFAGTYKFSDDFFQKNALVRIEPQDDHLDMSYPATQFTVALLPITGGRFFDRNFWSLVSFDGDKLIYRNGDTDYIAVRQ